MPEEEEITCDELVEAVQKGENLEDVEKNKQKAVMCIGWHYVNEAVEQAKAK